MNIIYERLDDFDYHVLRLQLFLNIITILVTIVLWTVDQGIDIHIVIKHEAKYTGGTGSNNCDKSTQFSDLWKASSGSYKWNDGGTPSNPCVHRLGKYNSLFDLFDLGTSDKSHAGDWSPIGMLAVSLGTVYAFYPSIAPYSIIDYQYASVIELWILIISAIPTLVIAILDTVDFGGNIGKVGPSGKFVVYPQLSNGSKTGPYAWDSVDRYKDANTPIPKPSGIIVANWTSNFGEINGYLYWLWNLIWLCAILYILCIQIFMTMLHYPDSLLSQFFNNNPLRIGFISVLFNTVRETMQAVGFSGAGKQIDGPSDLDASGYTQIDDLKNQAAEVTSDSHAYVTNKQFTAFDGTANQEATKIIIPNQGAGYGYKINGSIASINKPITLFVMMFCIFIIIVNEVVNDLEPPLKP